MGALCSKRSEGEVSLAELADTLALFDELRIVRVPARPLTGAAADLVARRRLTIYAAVHVVLAIPLHMPLVTADAPLARPVSGVPVEIVRLDEIRS